MGNDKVCTVVGEYVSPAAAPPGHPCLPAAPSPPPVCTGPRKARGPGVGVAPGSTRAGAGAGSRSPPTAPQPSSIAWSGIYRS